MATGSLPFVGGTQAELKITDSLSVLGLFMNKRIVGDSISNSLHWRWLMQKILLAIGLKWRQHNLFMDFGYSKATVKVMLLDLKITNIKLGRVILGKIPDQQPQRSHRL